MREDKELRTQEISDQQKVKASHRRQEAEGKKGKKGKIQEARDERG